MSSFAAFATKPPPEDEKDDPEKRENGKENETNDKDNESLPLRSVQISGSVLLQISKHAKDGAPNLVTGQLLGLDVGQTLEISASFPFPAPQNVGTEREQAIAEEEGAHYQLEMMRMLREVNVDNNTVGWYQSTKFGSIYSEELIETFANYAESIERCVCVVYDGVTSDDGQFGVRAVRLTDKFLKMYKECGGNLTSSKIKGKGVRWNDLVEEIPITISNSALVSAMMSRLDANAENKVEREPERLTKEDINRLHLNSTPFSSKSLEFLSGLMDDLVSEQQKVAYYHRASQRLQQQKNSWLQKRRAENAQREKSGLEPLSEENPDTRSVSEPNKLETYLILNQVNQFARQLEEHNATSAAKLKLVSSLRANETTKNN